MSAINLVKERILETIGREKLEDINELKLDDLTLHEFIPQINQQIQQFTNLEILTINACGLKSLANLPDIQSLRRIELEDNDFPTNDLNYLLKYPLL